MKYLSREASAALEEHLKTRLTAIKDGGQGTDVDELLGMLPNVEGLRSISLDYYDCDGVTVAAIKVEPRVMGLYDHWKGWKIKVEKGAVSRRHLVDYMWL